MKGSLLGELWNIYDPILVPAYMKYSKNDFFFVFIVKKLMWACTDERPIHLKYDEAFFIIISKIYFQCRYIDDKHFEFKNVEKNNKNLFSFFTTIIHNILNLKFFCNYFG